MSNRDLDGGSRPGTSSCSSSMNRVKNQENQAELNRCRNQSKKRSCRTVYVRLLAESKQEMQSRHALVEYLGAVHGGPSSSRPPPVRPPPSRGSSPWKQQRGARSVDASLSGDLPCRSSLLLGSSVSVPCALAVIYKREGARPAAPYPVVPVRSPRLTRYGRPLVLYLSMARLVLLLSSWGQGNGQWGNGAMGNGQWGNGHACICLPETAVCVVSTHLTSCFA
jgi:hypothetical protein